MKNLLISIVIPSFNREKFIEETLDSVLSQTYGNWECIIVDDGSTDNTISLVNGYVNKDHRFKILKRNRVPKGANTCRNLGLDKSKGKYIIFLDSDDLLTKNCLLDRINEFQFRDKCDFLVFPTLVLKDGKKHKVFNKPYSNYLEAFIVHDIPWTIMGPIWKTKFLKSTGGFDENLPRLQDVELNIRVLAQDVNFEFFHNRKPDNIYFSTKNRPEIKSTEKILNSGIYLIKKLKTELLIHHKFNTMNSKLVEFYIGFLKRYALYNYRSPIIDSYVNYDIDFSFNIPNNYILKIQRWFYNTEFLKYYPIKILSFFLWRFFTIKD